MGYKSKDFCPYKRREAQIHWEEDHVEAGRGGGEAAPDTETQGATGSWCWQEGFSSADLGAGLAY